MPLLGVYLFHSDYSRLGDKLDKYGKWKIVFEGIADLQKGSKNFQGPTNACSVCLFDFRKEYFCKIQFGIHNMLHEVAGSTVQYLTLKPLWCSDFKILVATDFNEFFNSFSIFLVGVVGSFNNFCKFSFINFLTNVLTSK